MIDLGRLCVVRLLDCCQFIQCSLLRHRECRLREHDLSNSLWRAHHHATSYLSKASEPTRVTAPTEPTHLFMISVARGHVRVTVAAIEHSFHDLRHCVGSRRLYRTGMVSTFHWQCIDIAALRPDFYLTCTRVIVDWRCSRPVATVRFMHGLGSEGLGAFAIATDGPAGRMSYCREASCNSEFVSDSHCNFPSS